MCLLSQFPNENSNAVSYFLGCVYYSSSPKLFCLRTRSWRFAKASLALLLASLAAKIFLCASFFNSAASLFIKNAEIMAAATRASADSWSRTVEWEDLGKKEKLGSEHGGHVKGEAEEDGRGGQSRWVMEGQLRQTMLSSGGGTSRQIGQKRLRCSLSKQSVQSRRRFLFFLTA